MNKNLFINTIEKDEEIVYDINELMRLREGKKKRETVDVIYICHKLLASHYVWHYK